jgi:hypothetical protein
MKKLLASALIAGPLLMGSTTHAQVINLVTNGDFASGDFTGWTTDGGDLPSLKVITNVANIDQADSLSGFKQSVGVTPGDVYLFKFDFTAVTFGTYSFDASWAGSTVLSFSGSSGLNTGPTTYSFTSQADAASEEISFYGLGSTGVFKIDNVSVERVPGPLPLLGAVAAFAWSRKLRNRIKQAGQRDLATAPA